MNAGLIGGIIGTYFIIKNTSGPAERTFIIKAAMVFWLFVILFISLLLIMPFLK